jgi:uncharacterized membrane protein
MTNLICFILSCYGVTNIVTSGKIFKWLRDLLCPIPVLGYWIMCPMCLSVPVGIGWFLLGLSPQIDAPFLVSAAACGMISSGSCWILRVALHRLGEDEL